ncbi:MAG: CBS domain-containing protein [Candidatus Methanomethyliaceae archaeon]|nr:CBS domain-containing protein [Candidatus Methanomethyliaceae archaeon]MDW7971103.1 CBS domain-containing protein [Nitrososphaerota archaeon]
MQVASIARHPPSIVLNSSVKISEAIRMLSAKNVRHAIISNDGIRVDGVISAKNIIKYIRKNYQQISKAFESPIEQIMNRNPIVARITDEIPDLIHLMIKNDIGFLPLLDEESRIWGSLSERHLFKLFSDYPTFIRVSEIMSKPLIGLDIKATLMDVINLMIYENIRRVPLISNNELWGIITIKDLIKFFSSSYVENIISQELSSYILYTNVCKIAKQNPKTINPEADLSIAVKIMKENDIGSLIVVSEDKPIGIITERDFLTKIPNLSGVEFIMDSEKKRVIIGRVHF